MAERFHERRIGDCGIWPHCAVKWNVILLSMSTFYKRRRPMTSDAELPFLPYSVSVNQYVPLLRCESATVTGRRRNVAMLVTI